MTTKQAPEQTFAPKCARSWLRALHQEMFLDQMEQLETMHLLSNRPAASTSLVFGRLVWTQSQQAEFQYLKTKGKGSGNLRVYRYSPEHKTYQQVYSSGYQSIQKRNRHRSSYPLQCSAFPSQTEQISTKLRYGSTPVQSEGMSPDDHGHSKISKVSDRYHLNRFRFCI